MFHDPFHPDALAAAALERAAPGRGNLAGLLACDRREAEELREAEKKLATARAALKVTRDLKRRVVRQLDVDEAEYRVDQLRRRVAANLRMWRRVGVPDDLLPI
jgi:hypothetical protein